MTDKPDEMSRWLHKAFTHRSGPFTHTFSPPATNRAVEMKSWEMTVEDDGTTALSGRVVGTPEAIVDMLANLAAEGITATVEEIK